MATRKRVWIDTTITESTADAGQDFQDLSENSSEVDFKGWTMVRMLISLSFLPATPVVDSLDYQQMFAGIGMVSDEATVA